MKLFIPVLLSISAFASICLADDDTRMSDGLRVLNQRVGTWKTETVTKPGVWVPEGGKSTGVETMQIAHALEDVLKPRGVGVVIEASHLCMMMRGVEKQNSKTITFKSNLANDISVDITMLFVNNDKVTWHGEWKNGDGQIMLEIDGTVTRIKEKKAEKSARNQSKAFAPQ